MVLHLIKLAVGAENLEDLAQWQKQRLKTQGELLHITRMAPKRADELVNGGSLYWVIKGVIRVRQRLNAIRPVTHKGGARTALVLDAKLVPVRPTPRRAFQGWRYLTVKDAPRDLPKGTAVMDMPEAMRDTLSELGLL
jgi:hypothetical protein